MTALRSHALSLAEGPERSRQLRRAWKVSRTALMLNILFPHERAHVLRERAILHWTAGRKTKAIKQLKRSVDIASSQQDDFQRNLSTLELAKYECELKVPGASERMRTEEALRQSVCQRIEAFRRKRWPNLK